MSVVVDPVDFTVQMIRSLTPKERNQVFEHIKDLLPQKVTEGLCVNGKEHKFKKGRSTDNLFGLFNKTQYVCAGCGATKWL